MTRGREGVKNDEKSSDVICECPLNIAHVLIKYSQRSDLCVQISKRHNNWLILSLFLNFHEELMIEPKTVGTNNKSLFSRVTNYLFKVLGIYYIFPFGVISGDWQQTLVLVLWTSHSDLICLSHCSIWCLWVKFMW